MSYGANAADHLPPAMSPHHTPGHSRSRSRSEASVAGSEATSTFYSFQDLDLAEPPTHPGERPPPPVAEPPATSAYPLEGVATEVSEGSEPRPSRVSSSFGARDRNVRRVDSGYESHSHPSSSSSSTRRSSHKSSFNPTVAAASTTRPKTSKTKISNSVAAAAATTTTTTSTVAGSYSTTPSSVRDWSPLSAPRASCGRRRQAARALSADYSGSRPVSHLPRHLGGATQKPVSRPRSQQFLTHRWALQQQQYYYQQKQQPQQHHREPLSKDSPPHPCRSEFRSLPEPPPLPIDSLFQLPGFFPPDHPSAAVSDASALTPTPLVDARASGAIVADPLPVSPGLAYLFPSPSPPPLAAALPMSRGSLPPSSLAFSSAATAAPVDESSQHGHHHHHQQEQQPQPSPQRPETPSFPLPAQTTHYWTSDRTRRLEYAAIDAATKGIKGWVMRHVVPDCFVPRDSRRAGFEEDGGSVIRYRIDLEDYGDADADADDDNYYANEGGGVDGGWADSGLKRVATAPSSNDGRRMSLHQQLRQQMRRGTHPLPPPPPHPPTLSPPPSRHRRRVFSLDEKRSAAAAVVMAPMLTTPAPAWRNTSPKQRNGQKREEEEEEEEEEANTSTRRRGDRPSSRRVNTSWRRWFLRPRNGRAAACS